MSNVVVFTLCFIHSFSFEASESETETESESELEAVSMCADSARLVTVASVSSQSWEDD